MIMKRVFENSIEDIGKTNDLWFCVKCGYTLNYKKISRKNYLKENFVSIHNIKKKFALLDIENIKFSYRDKWFMINSFFKKNKKLNIFLKKYSHNFTDKFRKFNNNLILY